MSGLVSRDFRICTVAGDRRVRSCIESFIVDKDTHFSLFVNANGLVCKRLKWSNRVLFVTPNLLVNISVSRSNPFQGASVFPRLRNCEGHSSPIDTVNNNRSLKITRTTRADFPRYQLTNRGGRTGRQARVSAWHSGWKRTWTFTRRHVGLSTGLL
jgi:hypothetical protein